MQATLWPKGLIGRVTVVMLIAILLEFVGSLLLHEQIDRRTVAEDHARRVAELLVVGRNLLIETPESDRAAVLHSLSTEHLAVELHPHPPTSSPTPSEFLRRIRMQMINWEPTLAAETLTLGSAIDGRGGQDLVGALRLHDGMWLQFRSRNLFGRWSNLYPLLFGAIVLTGGVIVAAGMVVRTLGAPLRNLAATADQVGRGAPVTILEGGPGDLNKVAQAFNAMQGRISHLIEDRTQALAAVSHDIRTPLARMRLRVGLLNDEEAREAIETDIDEMQSMLDSVLAYLAGENDNEAPRRVDLASLALTLVDEYADLGREVSYDGPDHLLVSVRPLMMKRALRNLIENGLKYGGAVTLGMGWRGPMVRLVIDDNGPGIPESELQHVLSPFFRLDQARSRDTNGMGLGLAIVANAVANEGGEFSLSNRPEGGLRAEILLPGETVTPA